MSTLTYIETADMEAGETILATSVYLWFMTNPETLLLLIYGDRPIVGAAPPHDHDEDGGVSLLPPILSHSFGQYHQNIKVRGIPIGPAASGSFAESTSQGITDKSTAKRLFCCRALLPGGVLGVRVSLTEYHESASLSTQLTVTFRALSSVNYKRGVAPEEASVDISYTTSGTAVNRNHSADLDDLSSLGDPARDREVEVALWLTSDVSATEEQRILDLEVLPLVLTAGTRRKSRQDPTLPAIALRALKAGVGGASGQLAGKVKALYNGLSIAAWGSTPGLLDSGQPDRRRRYQETITSCHQHRGRRCPTSTPGEIIGDGACLKDPQNLGYLSYLGETLPLVSGTPPTMDDLPQQGAYLHKATDTSTGWVRYEFRRSIPAGCGALLVRVACHAGYDFAAASYVTSTRLLMSLTVTEVTGGSDIVTRLSCGQYVSPLDSGDADYGFVELEPEEDIAHVSNQALFLAGQKGWNHGAEKTEGELAALQANDVLYRISKPVRVQLTYPPEQESKTYHPTTDYNVKIRFLMRSAAGDLDPEAGCLWISCDTAPGY